MLLVYLGIGLCVIGAALVIYAFVKSSQEEPDEATALPEWATMFTPGQYARFLQEVRRYFARKKLHITMDGETVFLEGELSGQFALHPLAQTCGALPRSQWRNAIAAHFEPLLHTPEEHTAVQDGLEDYEQIRGKLIPRILRTEALPESASCVIREDLPGTRSYLGLVLPHAIRSLTAEECAAWGKTSDELFEAALENLFDKYPVIKDAAYLIGPDITGVLMTGDHLYVASHALLLHRHPEAIGLFGALVAIPTPDTLLAYPIGNLQVADAVQALARKATDLSPDGPGSITAQIYWYQHGRYLDLPYQFDENGFNFSPPERYLDMLHRLKEQQANEGQG